MKVNDIRKKFFDFFESKQHKIVASAPIVVKNDPTLLFTNAGMNQFKDYFLGNTKADTTRVADTQKCLRVSGKHNDLEEVGLDTYHHTMFEMLGNWSFGDYFKREAIEWAWELLTVEFGIEKDNLYVTIFEGKEYEGLEPDSEAKNIWKEIVSEDRIINGNKKDNFWQMGDVGPCGPSSEIHVDIRSAEEKAKVSGRDLVNQDHPQVVEIWNLVFMEFNSKADGTLVPLPAKHVDTGMGLERLAMVLQHKQSNYDTDVFGPIITKIETLSGIQYSQSDDKKDVAIRVISDHIRAIAFAIADGQLPSNTGAGYVIRRILRRAVRYGYSFLDLKEAFLFELVDVLDKEMGAFFPEIKAQKQLIEKVIKEEEENFLRTLEKGLSRINEYVADKEGGQINGEFAFELYDTYGFPVDLTQLIVADFKNGFVVDMEEFDVALRKQKERSRAASKVETDDWVVVYEDEKEEFIGYDHTQTQVKITRYRKTKSKKGEQYQLVFNITPFYAEGGGQVGDTGYIEANGDKVEILDTKKENDLIVHFAEKLPANVNAIFTAQVDAEKRKTTACNHTATHLLHEALRTVLGEHVEQKGSLVHPDYLRFDFSHFSKVTDEELIQIEGLVNARIRANNPLIEKRSIPMQEALDMGAMALFGEKYGDLVRAIKFGSSVELCGGIHVNATGEIGLFKITSESAIAAGVRRIEAVSANKAVEYYKKQEALLEQVKGMLKNANDPIKGIEALQKENAELNKKVEKFIGEKASGLKDELLAKAEEINGVRFIAAKVDLDPNSTKNLVFELKKNNGVFVVLGGENNGKAMLTIALSDDLVKEKDLNAGTIIRELGKEIQGGGGGQAFFATAGGKNIAGIDNALQKAKSYL